MIGAIGLKRKDFGELIIIVFVMLGANLLDRLLDVQLMPAFLFLFALGMVYLFFKRHRNHVSIVWRMMPIFSLFVYAGFLVTFYLGITYFTHWEYAPWVTSLSVIAIFLYIVTFFPLFIYLSFKRNEQV